MLAILLLLLTCSDWCGSPLPVRESDAWRCPISNAEVDRAAKFADTHVDWLNAHGHSRLVAGIWGASVRVSNTDWHADADWRLRCWQALKMARDGHCVEANLLELRRLLGEWDYQLGRMPAPAPLWRFRELEKGEEP